MERIEKRENDLKDEYWRNFDPRYGSIFEVMQHQDVRKGGNPDSSLTGYRMTSWWEFKHATPNFKAHALQVHRCCRLARLGFCRYVIFYEPPDAERYTILVVHPLTVAVSPGRIRPEVADVQLATFSDLSDYMVRTHREFHCQRNAVR